MEQHKIGKFIYELRKEKELTQKQLSDLIGVSDKTISKWETQRGIPDTAIMNDLCKVLGISINELLSGERLSKENYNGKAEENMVNLLKDTEREKNKKKWSIINIILSLLWILLLVIMFAILGLASANIYWFFDIPSLILILGFLYNRILDLITGKLCESLTIEKVNSKNQPKGTGYPLLLINPFFSKIRGADAL